MSKVLLHYNGSMRLAPIFSIKQKLMVRRPIYAPMLKILGLKTMCIGLTFYYIYLWGISSIRCDTETSDIANIMLENMHL